MVPLALSRCASDDFRRLLSRGLAVGGVVVELVCGGVSAAAAVKEFGAMVRKV